MSLGRNRAQYPSNRSVRIPCSSDWNADDARIRRAEGLQCREERGLFDQHAVAGVDERAHDEVNALLGAGEHHHVADAALYASCAHMFGKQRTQLFESLDR